MQNAAATGFGGFGNAAAPKTGFGQTTPAAGGFGAPAATTGFGAAKPGGFGQTTPAATGFGAPAATGFGAPAATGFGAPKTGFGQTTPAAGGFGAPAATGFGAKPAGFGAPATGGFGGGFGAAKPGGFGAPATTGFALGGNKPGGFGTTALGGFGNNQMQQQNQNPKEVELLNKKKELQSRQYHLGQLEQTFYCLWDKYDRSALLTYNFMVPMYRVEDPQSKNFAGLLQNGKNMQDVIPYNTLPNTMEDLLINQAKEENPNPSKFIPELVVSTKGLLKRLDYQDKKTNKMELIIEYLENKINDTNQELQNNLAEKIRECKKNLKEKAYKVLELLCEIETLRQYSAPMTTQDEDLFDKMKEIDNKLTKPPTQYHARPAELKTAAHSLKDRISVGAETPKLDKASMDSIREFLEQQQTGLSHLMEIVREDKLHLQQMEEHLKKRFNQHQ